MKTNLVLQNEFIENLFVNQNESDIKKDLYDFIISDFSGFDLICDFNDENEYNQAVQENPIWELLLDKIDNIEFNKNLEKALKDDEFYKKIGEHNLFLLQLKKEECSKLSREKGYIFLTDENIDDVWLNFTKEKRNNILKVSNSEIIPEELRFDSWSKLDNFCPPLTSILIFDRYILNDESGQKLKHNLFPLLLKLLQNISNEKDITISIICEPRDWDIESRQKQLNAFLLSNGFTNASINIIKHCKAFYPSNFEGLHGRIILTNYMHIRSDDSFNFFNNKTINNDADIKINFSLSSKNKCFYKKELIDLKRYISKLVNNSENPKEEYKLLYYPSKKNYLLN